MALTAAICGVAFYSQARLFPYDGTVGSDSGIFAYGGKHVLMGELPYRDFWDHKPPAVFYLDALAILSFGESSVGIWAFGVVYVVLTGVAAFLLLRRWIGDLWAFIVTALTILTFTHPQYLHDANFTEVYALPLQFLALGTASAYASGRRVGWVLATGVLTALAFLLKPTTIGVGVASFVVLSIWEALSRGWRSVFRVAVPFAAGVAIPMLVVAAYWASRGAFSDLWQAVIVFNGLYVGTGLTLKWVYASARFILLSQPIGALAQLSLVSAALYLYEIRRSAAIGHAPAGTARNDPSVVQSWSSDPGQGVLFGIAFLALPIELVLASVGGKGYQHYYITPIPALSLTSVYLFMSMVRYFRLPDGRGFWVIAAIAAVAAITLPWDQQTLSQVRPSLGRIANIIRNRGRANQSLPPELQYVVDNTAPDQSVLFWGYFANDNFATHRRSPSRYFHVPALLKPGFDNAKRWGQFLDDLKRDPPELILGDHDLDPYFIPSDVGVCSDCAPEIRQGMQAFSAYVLEHYELAAQINRLQIFKRKPG